MPTVAKPQRKARRRKAQPIYVIIPKHQMRAKTPQMLADPMKAKLVALTDKLDNAVTLGSRSGAFRRVKDHKELKGKFWYRKIA